MMPAPVSRIDKDIGVNQYARTRGQLGKRLHRHYSTPLDVVEFGVLRDPFHSVEVKVEWELKSFDCLKRTPDALLSPGLGKVFAFKAKQLLVPASQSGTCDTMGLDRR
jgi:hypothetical protein